MSDKWSKGPFVMVLFIRIPPGMWFTPAPQLYPPQNSRLFVTTQPLRMHKNYRIYIEDLDTYCLIHEEDLPKLWPALTHELFARISCELGSYISDPDDRSAFYERVAIMFMEKAKDDL